MQSFTCMSRQCDAYACMQQRQKSWKRVPQAADTCGQSASRATASRENQTQPKLESQKAPKKIARIASTSPESAQDISMTTPRCHCCNWLLRQLMWRDVQPAAHLGVWTCTPSKCHLYP
eukprot:jgi/Botrbrau1/332/Bobra.0022s0289.2